VDEVLEAFRRFASRWRLLSSGNVLAAVSGGADSVAMLDLLVRCAAPRRTTLFCCYVNHGMRAQATLEERFVADLCRRLRVPFVLRRVGGRADWSEAAAREARYGALAEVARRLGCSVAATAHTADDAAETLLANLLRGAGADGLAGVPVRGSWNGLRIVRPLLGVRRGRLRDYLRERGLPYLTDATNYRPANMRSRIRHELLPLLEALRPGAVPAVARCALSLQVPDAPLGVSETLYFGLREIRLDEAVLTSSSGARATSVILRRLGGGPLRQERFLQLLGGGGTVDFGGGVFAAIESGDAVFWRAEEPPAGRRSLPVPGEVSAFGCVFRAEAPESRPSVPRGDPREEVIDADEVETPLVVRRLAAGERFVPLGATAPVAADAFLKKAGVPARRRRWCAAVADAADRVVWVVGLRLDARFATRRRTRRFLRVRLLEGVS